MGILDEAIREHLELKRQHGADDTELKQLEDDAFGPPRRPGASESAPDAASEAATEFMAQPDLSGVDPPKEEGPVDGPDAETLAPVATPRRESLADVQEAPEAPAEPRDADEEPEAQGPAEEQQPAGEHEAVTDVPDREPAAESHEPPGHTTEERHIIADQPTQMFDVEKEFDEAPDSAAAAPSDEELADEEVGEPRLGPIEPIGAIDGGDDPEDEEEDDFFDEQRLSDELDQALEAPLEVEDEGEYEEEEPAEEEHAPEEQEHHPAAREGDEDVLEETPDFLEEAPEDDQLWFEQKPPKDFDFDD
jgi:hypothetical protein